MADTIKLILQPSGRQGLPGPQGIPGETGPAGADGKTPVRGTDYWTEADKAEVVAEAVEQVKADAGSGLPEGATAYQQLVTDGDGVAKWEDRTHYASIQLSRELFAEKYGETTYLAELYLGVRISSLSGKKVIVTINDTDAYESECYLDRTVGAYKIDLGDGYSIKQSVTSDQAVFLGGKAEEYYSVKIEVLNGAETIHPLDQKYLPDTVATKEYVENAVANAGGSGGMDGATFIPAVSEAGVISWTNNGGLENPAPVNIKGLKGDTGEIGPAGPAGATPVKGTDYYTAADKVEMVNAVLAALPTWTGGSY